MKKGVVKFFNDEKGFGFITDDESGQDFFVHVTGVNGEITDGDKVEFDVEEGRKGLMAVNVTRL